MSDNVIYGVDFKAKFGPVLSPAEIEASWNAPFEVIPAVKSTGPIRPIGDCSNWYIAWPDTASSEYCADNGDCA